MIFSSSFPEIVVPQVALTDFVFARAAAFADRQAFVDAATGRALTFGDLFTHTRQLAAGLSARGIGKGDVVALWTPNIPEYGVVFYAVAQLGAILTPANPAYTAEELAFQLRDSGARLLFTTGALLVRAREAIVLSGAPIDIITIDATPGVPALDTVMRDADPPHVSIKVADDVVILPYSSGTTGLPKGVRLTHRNLLANLVQLDAVETAQSPAFLGLLPFFHIYGMMVLLNFGVLRGTTIVTLPRFDLETVLRVLQEWRIELAHVVPPIVLALAKHPAVDRFNLSGVRWLFSGAAPLGAELTHAVEQRLALRVRQGYGMTEASPATHYTVPGRERAGKAGQLLPSTECRVVDTTSGRAMGVGEVGELWVRGPQVMLGYLNNPEATRQTIDAEGWLHTGDIGSMDVDGYLEIVDRLKELIKVKGFQVAPAELEGLLVKHPQIADAAVIGIPDADAGEVPMAFVVARATLGPDEVMQFVEPHVAHYKRIRRVEFVDQIPKSASGKILRRVLVERTRATPR